MLTESDRKKMAAAIFEGQESAYSLERAIGADPTMATHHLHTILHSFSICHSVLNSQSQSSSPPTNKQKRKRKSHGKEEEEQLICYSPTLIIDEDGFSWRKYGQKPIKDSPHPRSYYRCLGNNCRAKKRIQIQKVQDNTEMFQTIYVGLHICLPDLVLDPAANDQSSMMLRFDQAASTDCIDDQTPIPIPVMTTDDQNLLLDDFWRSEQLEAMFSDHNDYNLDPFQF